MLAACLPTDKHSLGQISSALPDKSGDEQSCFSLSHKAAVVIAVESDNVFPGQSFVLSRMAKVFSPITCQDVWDSLTAWPTSFSKSLPRIRNPLSSLWSLLSSLKQNDPCFLFSWTNEAFLMIVIVFTHLRISNCTVTEYFFSTLAFIDVYAIYRSLYLLL